MAKKVNTDLFANTGGDDAPEIEQLEAERPEGTIPAPPAPDPNAARATVSFYFTADGRADLDAAWMALRERAAAQGTKVSSVSKSAIAELAVRWACADLDARGDDSALAQLLK